MLLRPTKRDLQRFGLNTSSDVMAPGGGLPWEGGQGGTILDPVQDAVLALAFNGSSRTASTSNTDAAVDELDLTADAAFSSVTNKRSISFWFNPISLTTTVDECVIAHWDWGANSASWAVMLRGASANKIQVRFPTAAGLDVLTGSAITSGTPITPAEWNHVLVVYDGAGASQALRCLIYVNGVFAASTNTGVPATLGITALSKLRAGRWNGVATSTAVPCPMRLRDVRIWGGTALAAGDATTLYAGGAVAGVTSTWTLNGDLLDSTTTNHGTGTPAAPAGPDWAMRTQTWPKPGTYTLLVVGDSNTSGSGFVGAWRREFVAHLWHRYGKKVRIVGRYLDTTTPQPFLARYPNHSGLSGQQIGANASSGMRGEIETDITNYLPDGIVIMGGTNDISTGAQTPAQTLARLQGWIDEAYATAEFEAADPIWICSILPRIDGDAADNAAFNALLPAEAAARQTASQNVIHILAGEQESERGLQADAVHASDIGHRKMGASIATALQSVVPA